MGKLSPELAAVVAATEILSASRFSLLGRHYEVDPRSAGDNLAATLAGKLYEKWYTRPGAPASGRGDFLAHREHVDLLSRANNGTGTWQPGWTVVGNDSDGRLAVEKDGLVYYPPADRVRSDVGEPTDGAACRVWVPNEMRDLQPGFYAAVGAADSAPPEDLDFQLRFYWHLRARGAPAWVRILTTDLNRRGIPFSLKVPSSPQHYTRADAGVLFLEPGHYREARFALRTAYREVRDHLRPEVPRLTDRLAPGLALAEGPANGASFGHHCCGLIAQGLIEASAGRPVPVERRVAAVSESFVRAGLDPRRPYLAPGSRSRYRPLPASDMKPRANDPAEGGRKSATTDTAGRSMTFTDAATRIGDWLCDTAYRSGGRCNWIGGRLGRPDPESGLPMPAVAALHADLYGGTAGVALFLAELFFLTGDRTHRETALAAQWQALDALRREPEIYRPLAFYAGRLGIASAGRRIAELTANEELANAADNLISDNLAAAGMQGSRPVDVMEGDAGAILALLRWHQRAREPALLDTALGLGADLLDILRREGGALARPQNAVVPGEHPPLTGFAHGAAGLGLALLELSRVSGDGEFRRAAGAAFDYETSCFNHEFGNWPDFRPTIDTDVVPDEAPSRYMTAWCHGAPGIALSRLRAIEVDPERASAYEAAARAGLATTEARVERALAEPDADTSLCHGLGGTLDILRVGAEALGNETLGKRASEVLKLLVARHADAIDWPSGNRHRAANPSLFMGLAGIGHTLLRFDHPDRVATVLLPGD